MAGFSAPLEMISFLYAFPPNASVHIYLIADAGGNSRNVCTFNGISKIYDSAEKEFGLIFLADGRIF